MQGNYDHSIGNRRADCACGYTDPRDNYYAQISYDYTLANTSDRYKDWLRELPPGSVVRNSITRVRRLRLRDADHAARETSAGVADRLRFQIVIFRMNDHGQPEDRILAAEFQHFIFQLQMRFAGSVRFEIS